MSTTKTNWKSGQSFDPSILKSLTTESVEEIMLQSGDKSVRKSIDVTVKKVIDNFMFVRKGKSGFMEINILTQKDTKYAFKYEYEKVVPQNEIDMVKK